MSTRPTAADPQYHPVVRSVARGLRKRCGVPERSVVLLAVSGGADSVALLRSLALLAPRRRWRHRLVVAHVHHGLRGADADQDQRFVKDIADRLGLEFLAQRLEGLADRPGNVEATAREARYASLYDMAIERGCGYVATGHHADDQLETMLLRMIRGATPGSLSAMRWSRPLLVGAGVQLVRPMLAVDPADARAFLQGLDQPWREDPTNQDAETRARARLRRDVLPALRAINPKAARNAVRLADRLRERDASER